MVQLQRGSVLVLSASLIPQVSSWLFDTTSTPSKGPQRPKELNLTERAQHPNATNSIPFTYQDHDGWKLRINVTESKAPGVDDHSEGRSTKELKDPRILTTIYALEWPGNANFSETIKKDYDNSTDANFCLYPIRDLFTAKATNAWIIGGPDCSGPLGVECYDGVMQKLKDVSEDDQHHCNYGAGFFKEVDACKEALAEESTAWPTPQFLNVTNEHNSTNDDHASGDGFLYVQTPAYEAGDMEAYERETERLHMLIMGNQQKGVEMLCMRVDPTVDVKNSGPAASNDATRKPPGSTIALWLGIVSLVAFSL